MYKTVTTRLITMYADTLMVNLCWSNADI